MIRTKHDAAKRRPLMRLWMVVDLSRKFEPFIGDLYDTQEAAQESLKGATTWMKTALAQGRWRVVPVYITRSKP